MTNISFLKNSSIAQSLSKMPSYMYYGLIALVALIGILMIVSMYRILKKANLPRIFCIIPVINVILCVVAAIKLKEGAIYVVGILLLPVIFIPVVAFSKTPDVEKMEPVVQDIPVNTVNPALNSVNIPDAEQVQNMFSEKQNQNNFGINNPVNQTSPSINQEDNNEFNAFDFTPMIPDKIEEVSETMNQTNEQENQNIQPIEQPSQPQMEQVNPFEPVQPQMEQVNPFEQVQSQVENNQNQPSSSIPDPFGILNNNNNM